MFKTIAIDDWESFKYSEVFELILKNGEVFGTKRLNYVVRTADENKLESNLRGYSISPFNGRKEFTHRSFQ